MGFVAPILYRLGRSFRSSSKAVWPSNGHWRISVVRIQPTAVRHHGKRHLEARNDAMKNGWRRKRQASSSVEASMLCMLERGNIWGKSQRNVLGEWAREEGMTVSKGGSHSTINKMTPVLTHSTYVEKGAGYITAGLWNRERKEKKYRKAEGKSDMLFSTFYRLS